LKYYKYGSKGFFVFEVNGRSRTMAKYYKNFRQRFNFLQSTSWRSPQIGALSAAISHWTTEPNVPALVSIPTGSGKTAVAMAAPYIVPDTPQRVLIVVPSSDLRKQTSERFSKEYDLRIVSAISRTDLEFPAVKRMTSRVDSWSELEDYDVVVALPNTISPRYYPESPPPVGLFDLVVIDEAHHTPAATWLEILNHFEHAYSLLLTATPIRRDGKRLPGKQVYYFPIRLAINEGIYKPLDPHILEPDSPGDRDATDRQIAKYCSEILAQEIHATSTLIVRANSIDRSTELSELYADIGLELTPLHSRLGHRQREKIIHQLREGNLRGVAVVGMLGEGFDLGSIRLLAYHDKHKSLPATIQLFGRLTRTDPEYPQPAVLVTVRDTNIYPELQGVVRELYEEDQDWIKLLPRIIDEEIQEERENAAFALRFSTENKEIHPSYLNPLLRSVIYEITDPMWRPFFLAEELPSELEKGKKFNGGQIVYSEQDGESGLYLLVVKHFGPPRWCSDPGVLNVEYHLHLLAFKQAPTVDRNNLLFINTESQGAHTTLKDLLNLDEVAQRIAPESVDAYVNSLERHSVSGVGVRNTNPAGRGTVGYRNYMGSGVDSGLRSVDTYRTALGHGNFQVDYLGTSANGGFSVEKAKVWLNRYLSIRQYVEWIEDISSRLWYPAIGPSGPILPGIDRGKLFTTWPESPPFIVEMSPQIYGRAFVIVHEGIEYPIEDIDFQIPKYDQPLDANDQLDVKAVVLRHTEGTDEPLQLWEGWLEPGGKWNSEDLLVVRRGYYGEILFTELLEKHPPAIFFLNGSTIMGSLLYESKFSGPEFDPSTVEVENWIEAGVDITAETRRTAAKREPPAISIDEYLEDILLDRQRIGTSRWILQNDGSGEIADYLVIEPLLSGEIHLSLWHAKYAAGTSPSVRSSDFEEVVSQAIKSRRWFKRRSLWNEIRMRLEGSASPRAYLVDGSDDEILLNAYLGGLDEDSSTDVIPWTEFTPNVRGNICIAQPGLSRDAYIRSPDDEAARSITQLLTVLSDTAQADALNLIVLGSG
jgi:superfamily II DNA or RNA helicase